MRRPVFGLNENTEAPMKVPVINGSPKGCVDDDSNLGRMIDTYRRLLPNDVQILNISEFDFQGGCLGCFHCAFEGECVYRA